MTSNERTLAGIPVIERDLASCLALTPEVDSWKT